MQSFQSRLYLTQRHSPVPFNVRQTINGTTLFDDNGEKLYIPPKTR